MILFAIASVLELGCLEARLVAEKGEISMVLFFHKKFFFEFLNVFLMDFF